MLKVQQAPRQEDQAAMPTKRPGSVEARHNLFAHEYASHRNGTKAAVAAGYSAANAKAQASRLLSRPNIKALVAECDADLIEKTDVTKEWVVRETVHTYGKALEQDQFAAARSCLHLLALLHGYVVERKDVRVIANVKDLTDAELAAIAATVIDDDPVEQDNGK
jgi:hypothetical protein